jgi:hypothetical protein
MKINSKVTNNSYLTTHIQLKTHDSQLMTHLHLTPHNYLYNA